MECSLEIVIRNNDCSNLASLAIGLPSKYASTVSPKTGYLSISVDDFEFQNWLVFDDLVCAFIEGLSIFGSQLVLEEAIFRVAVYYSLDETLVFPFRMSKRLIQLISEVALSVDITGYPCVDEG